MAEYKNNVPVEYYHKSKPKADDDKWWTVKDENLFENVFSTVHKINESQSYRSINNLRFARLYANSEMVGLKPGQHSRVINPKSFLTNRVTYNVIKSNIDSACAKISKEKPRPIYLTENGQWLKQQKANRLSQYIQGTFSVIGTGTGENKTLYGLGRQAFKDCGIFGTGAVHFFSVGDKIKAERYLIDDITIDDDEGMYGMPRSLHGTRFVYRDVLKSLYPLKAKFIDEAMATNLTTDFKTNRDMLEVIESWRLPSAKEAKDGRHSICISNATLNDKGDGLSTKYEDDYFPFLFQRWGTRTVGFFGQGIAEELLGIQLEINKILRVIAISQHLMSVPQVWLEMSNQNNPKQINNEIGGQKYYLGAPPIFTTNNAVNPELYEHLERLYKRSFEITGNSELSASGKKPAGLDAGVALREYRDIEQERFSMQQNMYEDWFMDASDLILKMSRKLAKEGKDPVVQFKDGNSMKVIKFSDVDIKDDDMMCRPYPTNFLPSTPAGKLQTVKEMIADEMYTKEEGLELLDFPDLEKTNNLKLAQKKDIYKVIETMIETKKYQPPEPYMNLELAKTLSQSYYLRGRCDDMPEEILDLLRQFMDDVKSLIDEASTPPQQPVQDQSQMIAPPIPPNPLVQGLPGDPQLLQQSINPMPVAAA